MLMHLAKVSSNRSILTAETPGTFSETLAIPCGDDEQRLNLSQVHKHEKLISKCRKLLRILLASDQAWLRALRLGVAASVEHNSVLRHRDCRLVINIGTIRGQFALVARHNFPKAKIISFEPLPKPAALFRKVFSIDETVVLHIAAIGPKPEQCVIHVSARDDSSSLLPISSLQEEIFPGTSEVGTVDVQVEPLDSFVTEDDIRAPAMLKLDVQGFELDTLQGCETLLSKFDWIYCECSFVELYSGQKLAGEVIAWLRDKGFRIEGMYNPSYDNEGLAIQADFLFQHIDLYGMSCG